MSIINHATDNLIPLVAPFADFDCGNVALAGGKGANLGEIIRAGFSVPGGFVITTRAYDVLLQANGLHFDTHEGNDLFPAGS